MHHNWFGGKGIIILEGNKYIGNKGDKVSYDCDGKLYNPHTKEYGWYMWKVADGNNDIEKLNDYFKKVPDKFRAKFKLL